MSEKLTSAQIRQLFLDYFAARGHEIVPSASLVPQDDPTLLFTNAGMNQFKDVFLATGSRPYRRAADTQKCMRVSGKHNDLDEVGRDGYHHTFFEMLGNWSFGDYYKKEAIGWAWDLLTRVYGLPKERLWVTVFQDDKGDLGRDEEAAGYWASETDIAREHITFFGRKDNFWEMGDTGPCGPCSEIHIDRGPAACDKQHIPGHVCAVNGGCARFIEIWNLVFIQYNRFTDGHLEPLPAKHVDTGMGFERLCSLLQGVNSNYETDLFTPLLDRTQELAGQSDAERAANLTAYRVIADHIRGITFLIGDGVLPANEGRGYVLRMVLRRAVRFGRKLGFTGPFLAPLADEVIAMMGHQFPELPQRAAFIKATITGEEERFLRTLDQGLARLEEVIARVKAAGERVITGPEAFFLYDTLGLPLEVTKDVAEEVGLTVDEAGYRAEREEARARARAASDFTLAADEHARLYPQLAEQLAARGATVQYDPYSQLAVEAAVLGLIWGDEIAEAAPLGEIVELVLDRTCFYVESGGQVADTGRIVGPDWEVVVTDTRRPVPGLVVHVGRVVSGLPRVGDAVRAEVDAARRWDIMRNHTATHLLHRGLRETLGSHVAQAGSLVAPDRLRFDYSHNAPLTPEQRAAIERIMNEAILANYPVVPRQEKYRDALAQGVIALFEEKYGEIVRVLRIGDADAAPFSQELCGGTHVTRTGDIGLCLIVSEESIGSGKRRIEAVTGRGALAFVQALRGRQEQMAALVESTPEELPARLTRLHEELHAAHKEVAGLIHRLARSEFEALLGQVQELEGVPFLAARVTAPDVETLREMADWFRDKVGDGVVVLGTVLDDKPLFIAATTPALVKQGIHAGTLVKEVARIVGGGGGGKPELAQAGGKDSAKLDEALAHAATVVKRMRDEGGKVK